MCVELVRPCFFFYQSLFVRESRGEGKSLIGLGDETEGHDGAAGEAAAHTIVSEHAAADCPSMISMLQIPCQLEWPCDAANARRSRPPAVSVAPAPHKPLTSPPFILCLYGGRSARERSRSRVCGAPL
ncbi:MAG: hypothetical protein ACPIOQ_11765 [Promethearchaeia archaeon]